jgi:death-on-curing protein
MIAYQEVLAIHQTLLEAFGGAAGVREEGLLQSAIERPFAGFGESEFYSMPAEKAGAVAESIVKNHPFVDGNKRTGYVLMRLLLMHFGQDLQATQDEKYDFVIGIASGQLAFPEIIAWINAKLARKGTV